MHDVKILDTFDRHGIEVDLSLINKQITLKTDYVNITNKKIRLYHNLQRTVTFTGIYVKFYRWEDHKCLLAKSVKQTFVVHWLTYKTVISK